MRLYLYIEYQRPGRTTFQITKICRKGLYGSGEKFALNRLLNSCYKPCSRIENMKLNSYINSVWSFLQRVEEKFLSEKENGEGFADTQLQYSWCLIRSRYKDDIRKGVELLKGKPYSERIKKKYLIQKGDFSFKIVCNYQFEQSG